MTSNSARRRAERNQERDRRRRRPIIMVNDRMVAAGLGEAFDASTTTLAELPEKRFGVHRFVVFCGYRVDVPQRLIGDPDTPKLLGPQNLVHMHVGCWDCEQPWEPDMTPCPSPGEPE